MVIIYTNNDGLDVDTKYQVSCKSVLVVLENILEGS